MRLTVYSSVAKATSVLPIQNVVVSPLIVYAILNLANSGARNKTSDELNEALHRYSESDALNDDEANRLIRNFPNIDRSISTIIRNWMNNEEYDLHLANRVLITNTYEIIDQFRRDVMEYSNTQVEQVDFAANSAEILQDTNSWVSEITKGKINKILDSVRADTLFIILSAR
ncbi:serine (or cysteine) proteinase inhibitor: clade B: member 9e-like protein [Leptotrombidium deliense]|uniref:Serine (Or cysteine) proteinase inhibitor: clade B: member 9e-like protein n=1 Tax=Leptotrombidium deliense TaxID=299467 RepID=A0A443SPE7_9ACAR|nr:serine (or cysteine) proteinase inhibitor: clade B: member 9e-like protein [Leptotrombidium deliense]